MGENVWYDINIAHKQHVQKDSIERSLEIEDCVDY